jgi:hypothetical protein
VNAPAAITAIVFVFGWNVAADAPFCFHAARRR